MTLVRTGKNAGLLSRLLTSASIPNRFSPVQHCFVADRGYGFVLFVLINLGQAAEECFRLRFQSQYGQALQDSRSGQRNGQNGMGIYEMAAFAVIGNGSCVHVAALLGYRGNGKH